MARLQYQRSAKAGGYNPQQVDERNIARMREETARQIDGMRRYADADIQNRQRVAQAMKEDAAAVARQQERNFQIQTQNSQRRIQGLQAQAQVDQQQAAIDQKATETIFDSIASLSATAAEYSLKKQKEQEQTKFNESMSQGLSEETGISRSIRENTARQAEVAKLGGIQEAQAKGADGLVAAKMKSESAVAQLDFAKDEQAKFWGYDYERLVLAEINRRESEGQVITRDDVIQIISEIRGQAYKVIKNNQINSELVKPYSVLADNFDRSLITQYRNKEEKLLDEQRGETHLAFLQNALPEDLPNRWLTSWPHIVDVYGFKGGLDKLQSSVFVAYDSKKGKFALSEDQIGQLPLFTKENPDGIAFQDKFAKGRWADILSERVKIENQQRKQVIDRDNLANAELEDTLVRAVMENPTVERLREAQQMFTATAFRESKKLAIVEKHLTYTAQHKNNIISAVTKLRDFELTPEIVAAAVAANPTEGKAIKDRYDAYTAKWKSDSYKKSNKALETLVSGTTQFGTTKAATAGSLPMISYLQAELRERAAQYESPTLSFEAAHQKAAGELAQEYRNGYRDKTNTFYRKVGRNGTVSYPNLPVGNVSAAEQVKRDVADLRTAVKTIGVEGVLDTPLSVASAERLDYIKKNFYKDDFKPTPKELAFIGMSKGMPLHEAYNRFFEANGDSFRLNSPLRLNGQEVTLTPEDRKVLGDPTKGPQAKLAVINRILNPGMYQTAQSMRPGSPFLVYTSGNIGPTSTGPHLDVKQVGGGEFAPSALDEYIEVDDPELGVVPLSQVPITGSFAEHTARGSHGIDYGLYSGTKIYAKNGARLIGTTPSEHGDVVTIQLPDGKQYTFLHGTAAK